MKWLASWFVSRSVKQALVPPLVLRLFSGTFVKRGWTGNGVPKALPRSLVMSNCQLSHDRQTCNQARQQHLRAMRTYGQEPPTGGLQESGGLSLLVGFVCVWCGHHETNFQSGGAFGETRAQEHILHVTAMDNNSGVSRVEHLSRCRPGGSTETGGVANVQARSSEGMWVMCGNVCKASPFPYGLLVLVNKRTRSHDPRLRTLPTLSCMCPGSRDVFAKSGLFK